MDVMNFGVSGATMMKGGDLPYWEQQEYKVSGCKRGAVERV